MRRIVGEVARRGLIDRDRPLNCLECGGEDQFGDWYARTLQDLWARSPGERAPVWTDAAAVGGRVWVGRLADGLPVSWRTVTEVAGPPGTFALRVSNRRREGLLHRAGR